MRRFQVSLGREIRVREILGYLFNKLFNIWNVLLDSRHIGLGEHGFKIHTSNFIFGKFSITIAVHHLDHHLGRSTDETISTLNIYHLCNAKLFKRRECNNCWEAQPNRPLLHSRRLNNDHYIKTFSVIRCHDDYCKKFWPKIATFRNFLQ